MRSDYRYMNTRFLLLLIAATAVFAQKHEVGLTLGRFTSSEISSPSGKLELGSGNGFQAGYGYRVYANSTVAIYGGAHLLASPQRKVNTTIPAATTDVATLYLTPDVRLKLLPNRRVSPWVAIGGGYAQYEHSLLRRDGQPNQAPRRQHGGAFTFGGGMDVRVLPWLSLRGEIRDFYTGSPNYNVLTSSGKRHNVVLGGGFVLRFGD